jgi:hypothetical protein
MTDPQTEFARAMRDVYARAKSEAGYNATYLLRMLSQHGPGRHRSSSDHVDGVVRGLHTALAAQAP